MQNMKNLSGKTKVFVGFLCVLLVVVSILYFFDVFDRFGNPFESKTEKPTTNYCTNGESLSNKELIQKLSDSVYHLIGSKQLFKEDPVSYFSNSSIRIINEGKLSETRIQWSVGYTYQMMFGALVSGTFHNDQELLDVYTQIKQFLSESTYPISRDYGSQYFHQNRESSCSILEYREFLGEALADEIVSACNNLYEPYFELDRDNPDSYCPVELESIQFLADMSTELLNDALDLSYYQTEYRIQPSYASGKGIDYLILYEGEGQEDSCKKDAYFLNIAQAFLYMYENKTANDGKYQKFMLMELLNTVSYGLQSRHLNVNEKDVLLKIKDDLFRILEDNTIHMYSTSVPYGSVEVYYMEICMRDNDFFKGLDTVQGLISPLDDTCDYEKLVIDEMTKRSCDVSNGESVFLYSPPTNSEGLFTGTTSYASLPHTVRIMLNLISISERDGK